MYVPNVGVIGKDATLGICSSSISSKCTGPYKIGLRNVIKVNTLGDKWADER
jgi:hypothetical protein